MSYIKVSNAIRSVARHSKWTPNSRLNMRQLCVFQAAGNSDIPSKSNAGSWIGLAMAASLGIGSMALCEAPKPTELSGHEIKEKRTLFLDRVLNEELVSPVAGVKSYTCASYKANLPIEDRFFVHVDHQVVLAAVLDGHGGWQVSEYAHDNLAGNVKEELAKLNSKSIDDVTASLVRAFVRTDSDIKEIVRGAFDLGFGNVNRVGACSLLAYIKDNLLVVANAGDVRAVLGSIQDDKLIATPLSNDHNAKLPVEMARLAREHPGEDNIVVCKHPESCYVKGGLQPTRALGDFAFKDADFNASPVPTRRGGGRHIAAPYTPPYVLAVPETQSHILTAADKFLILGSDGVWDFLTNQEAVEIVSQSVARGEAHLAGRAVVEYVLLKAAESRNMSLDEILEVPAGKARRRLHDDTTVVVLYLN